MPLLEATSPKIWWRTSIRSSNCQVDQSSCYRWKTGRNSRTVRKRIYIDTKNGAHIYNRLGTPNLATGWAEIPVNCSLRRHLKNIITKANIRTLSPIPVSVKFETIYLHITDEISISVVLISFFIWTLEHFNDKGESLHGYPSGEFSIDGSDAHRREFTDLKQPR